MWTVAARHKKATGPLDAYDSFNDKHLVEYFRKRTTKEHLAQVGVVPSIRPKPSAGLNYCYCSRDVSPPSSRIRDVKSRNATPGVSAQYHETAFPVKHSISPYLFPVVPSKLPVLKNREIRPHVQKSLAKASCEVTLLFHGGRHVLQKHQRHVKILQQHCGGTSRIVFSRHVAPGETFTFPSHRRFGHAFSIVLFVDEVRDMQLSSCCEYRYNKGSRLARSLFTLIEVKGGSACYKCRLEGRTGGPPDLVPKQVDNEVVTTSVEGDKACDEVQRVLDFICDTVVEPNEETCKRSSPSSNDSIVIKKPEIIPEDTSLQMESKVEPSTESEGCPPVVRLVSGGEALRVIRADSPNESEDRSVGDATEGDRVVCASPIPSTAYNVRDKKNQWGPDPGRGGSFSSDEDHCVVVTVVTADVHVSP